MTDLSIPCPDCTDGFTSHGDRQARTNKDVCKTCGGTMVADARTGQTPDTSAPPLASHLATAGGKPGEGELREALEKVRGVIANPNPGITDTVWFSETETLLDYIDAALSSLSKPSGGEAHERHAWCQPGDDAKRRWLVFFEDTEQGIATFTDEKEAREYYSRANAGGWNCYLFAAAPQHAAFGRARTEGLSEDREAIVDGSVQVQH